ARAHLIRAEGFFRQALESEPEYAEARLRHGRMLGLLGRHQAAAGELRAASGGLNGDAQQYYAALFLGAEEEALGHREGAQTSFERASAQYPRAQSPLIALSHLARRFGDRPGALAAIGRLMQLPPDESQRFDPWWQYDNGAFKDEA